MTREEAQALAEELVLRMSRDSWKRRRMGQDALASTYCEGLQAQIGVLRSGGALMSNSMVMMASVAIELLREVFASMDESVEDIREAHALGLGLEPKEVPS